MLRYSKYERGVDDAHRASRFASFHSALLVAQDEPHPPGNHKGLPLQEMDSGTAGNSRDYRESTAAWAQISSSSDVPPPTPQAP